VIASFPGCRRNSLATYVRSNCYFRCQKTGSTNQISKHCHMTILRPNCIIHWNKIKIGEQMDGLTDRWTDRQMDVTNCFIPLAHKMHAGKLYMLDILPYCWSFLRHKRFWTYVVYINYTTMFHKHGSIILFSLEVI